MNTNELAANTVDGVYNCESAAAKQHNKDVLQEMDFYNALATLEDGETIYGVVSDDLAARIEEEYGIH